MKITNTILTILFLLFAVVQYNDLDPWFWMTFYGFIALLSAFAIFKKYDKRVLLIGLGIASLWMFSLIPDFINWVQLGMPTIATSMKAEAPHIELTREFFGLLLCILTLIFHYRQAKQNG